MTKKLVAEFIGTMTLVWFGCGAAVLAGAQVGQLGIAFAFGLAIVAMAYGIGPISGCHINPAVSFGAWVAGRMSRQDMFAYWAAQALGGVVGAGLLLVIASGAGGYLIDSGLGQNGYGAGSPGGYSLLAGFVFEVLATFVFLVTILGVTQKEGAPSHLAGLAIGLTLVVIHIVGIQVTGVSVNPARSLGPAVWVGGEALSQLWLFIVAPMAGAGLAGWAFRAGVLSEES